MCVYYAKTAIGASHLRSGKPCQDHSSAYHDGERTIVTVCDGHGGALYLRSDRGSRFASFAVIDAFLQTDRAVLRKPRPAVADALRVRILSEWNRLVAQDLNAHPLRSADTAALTDDQKRILKQDPYKAYGTTVHGAMLLKNRLICVSLGDGGIFLCRNGQIASAFPEDEDQVANLTHSLCEEDAGRYLNVSISDSDKQDGVLLCTDGVINPYGNMENFQRSLVLPALKKIAVGNIEELSGFVADLGKELGTGDDVSLALLLRKKAVQKYGKGGEK